MNKMRLDGRKKKMEEEKWREKEKERKKQKMRAQTFGVRNS
jgi:hypothetical protein